MTSVLRSGSFLVNWFVDQFVPEGRKDPTVFSRLDAAAQRKVIAALVPAGKLSKFLGGGLSDELELKMSKIPANAPAVPPNGQNAAPANGQNAATGQRIDLYFIANGDLATVANKNFMKQQINAGNKQPFLTNAQLEDRNITVNANLKERYAHVDFNLFNMVQVAATGHGLQTTGQSSELVAFILDPRFKNDPKYPNQWQSIGMGPGGGKVLGPILPYDGAGGYAKVTKLLGSTDQVFIEYHLVFDEPFGWFNGKPVLTSKLPDKFRSDVRSFRRDLKAFPGAAAAAQPAAVPADQPAKAAPSAGNQPAKAATSAASNSPVSAAAQSETKKK
jgi:hypothetical protein